MSVHSNHRLRSAQQHNFSVVPQVHRPRSAFKCDHGYKTTFNNGYWIPFFWDEVNPGDTFKVRLTAFIRFATLLFPLMDNVKFYTNYFFVPNRLTWENWKKFMGEQVNPSDSIAFTVPKMTSPAVTGYTEGTIYDYLGLPTNIPGYDHISLPLRAYNQIYNYWLRDENLINSVPVNIGNTADADTDYVLRRSNKIRDYFTSALPFAQKGTAVPLPLGTTAPIIKNPAGAPYNNPIITDATNDAPISGALSSQAVTGYFLGNGGVNAAMFDPNGSLVANLASATAATVNDIRTAFQIQRFLERDARSGTRYSESLQSHWGVSDPQEAVLQYPQFLGGSSSPLNIHVVAQNSGTGQTGQTTPLASLAGFGTAVIQDSGFSKSFTEHGIVMGLITARADLNYQQGLNRKWSRSVRYDYPYPVFAHLGEQPVLNKEIYVQGTANPTQDAQIFGYQERYAENRFYPNLITGLFKTSATGSLDSWHLAQSFSSLPTLGQTFIEDNAPTTRVKATSSDPDFIMDAIIHQTLVSVLPTYSVPGLIDHF